MKQVVILGGLLAISLVGSYMTWTADDSEDISDGVVLVSTSAADLESIEWQEEKKTATVVRKKDKVGEYIEVTFVERKEIRKRPEKPKDDAKKDDATKEDGDATKDGDDKAGDEAPEEEEPPEIKVITQVFTGNDAANDLWESFAPLMALRELALSADNDGSAFGLDEPDGSITITGRSTTKLAVGSEAYGTRDRYVKSGDKVYLVDDKTLRPLQFANTRMVERRLHGVDDQDMVSVTVTRGADTRTFTQQNAADRGKSYWADVETPDDKDIEGGTYVDKLSKLRAQKYVAEADTPAGLTPAFTFVVKSKNETWTVQVLEAKEGDSTSWYALSSFNRSLVELTRSLASEAIADLDTLFDGKAAEEDVEEEPPPVVPGQPG